MNKKRVIVIVGILAVMLLATTAFAARGRSRGATARVYWNWDVADEVNPVGMSILSRSQDRLKTNYFTSELTPGQAMTLWFIFFNYPDLCSDGVCGLDDLGADKPAQGDFHLADGRVIGNRGYTWFRGSLNVGDTSGSGLAELGMEPVALVNPKGALFNLAVHSHGPALTGDDLIAQLNSYTGGCIMPFLGIDGFAGGFDELPVNPGECSTIQQSIHIPK